MRKKQRVGLILDLLKAKDLEWEVLSNSTNTPNHIRVKGFGDIWPSTGTYCTNGKFTKKNFESLIKALGGDIKQPAKESTTKDRVNTLESDSEQLRHRVEELESEVYQLRKDLTMLAAKLDI